MMLILSIGNSNLLTLYNLYDMNSGQFLNSATVTVTLKDLNGGNVAGQSWPTTMVYEAASTGKYEALLEYDLAVSDETRYVAVVDATVNGLIGHWEIPVTARIRTS